MTIPIVLVQYDCGYFVCFFVGGELHLGCEATHDATGLAFLCVTLKRSEEDDVVDHVADSVEMQGHYIATLLL
jgi:hypothetical protein